MCCPDEGSVCLSPVICFWALLLLPAPGKLLAMSWLETRVKKRCFLLNSIAGYSFFSQILPVFQVGRAK
jgi:hypothetical protein